MDRVNMTYKLYIRLHLDFGDIIYYNQRSDMMNLTSVSSCGNNNETTIHYLLGFYLYLPHRNILLSNISDILHSNVEIPPDIHLSQILLYVSNVYNNVVNKLIIHETIIIIKNTYRYNIGINVAFILWPSCQLVISHLLI